MTLCACIPAVFHVLQDEGEYSEVIARLRAVLSVDEEVGVQLVRSTGGGGRQWVACPDFCGVQLRAAAVCASCTAEGCTFIAQGSSAA